MNGGRVRGEVFFFNNRALILRKEREYVLLNICKHEDLKLTILERSERGQLREEVEGEVVRPGEILAIILD